MCTHIKIGHKISGDNPISTTVALNFICSKKIKIKINNSNLKKKTLKKKNYLQLSVWKHTLTLTDDATERIELLSW